VAALKVLSDRPLAVGFGLSDPRSLAVIRRLGATPVIGSALVQELSEGRGLGEALAARMLDDI
jgi:tryptophan synthase alpha subunit